MYFPHTPLSDSPPSLLRRRRRILIQNPLLHQLLRLRSLQQLLLQTIRPHMFLQLFLLALYSRGGRSVREYVACILKEKEPNMSVPILPFLPILNNMAVPNEKKGCAYVQSAPPSPASSPIPSAGYRSLAGALIPTARIVGPCGRRQHRAHISKREIQVHCAMDRGRAYGAAFVSRRIFLFFKS